MIPVRSLTVIAVAAVLLTWIPAAGADAGFSVAVQGNNRSSHGGFHRPYHGPSRGQFHGYPRFHGSYRYHFGYPGYYGYRPYYGPYWRPGYAYRGLWYPPPVEPRCIYRYGYLYCR